MPALTGINSVLTDAQKVIETWAANPSFSMGDVTLDQFTQQRDRLLEMSDTIDSKRHELDGLLDDRDDQRKALWDLITRARSGFRATFGPDSAQYDQAGGVRKSERKSRSARNGSPANAKS